MNIREANRVRACLDCGEHGALLWRTTKGENPGRLVRICAACLRKDDWHRFGLIERQPIFDEVPTEFVEGEWCWPTDDSDPAAVVTCSEEPSPKTGHVGWMWWALGAMGDAPTYEAACTAAVAEIQRRITAEIADGLSPRMRHELTIALERNDRWPHPLDGRSAEALKRRGLVTMSYDCMATTEMRLTDLGRAVADEIARRAGR